MTQPMPQSLSMTQASMTSMLWMWKWERHATLFHEADRAERWRRERLLALPYAPKPEQRGIVDLRAYLRGEEARVLAEVADAVLDVASRCVQSVHILTRLCAVGPGAQPRQDARAVQSYLAAIFSRRAPGWRAWGVWPREGSGLAVAVDVSAHATVHATVLPRETTLVVERSADGARCEVRFCCATRKFRRVDGWAGAAARDGMTVLGFEEERDDDLEPRPTPTPEALLAASACVPILRARRRMVRKRLSWLLRHPNPHVTLDAQGWAPVDAVLHACPGLTLDRLRDIATADPKSRFVLDGQRVRAAHGHSVPLQDPIVRRADAAPAAPVLHATTRKAAWAIRETGELRSMRRTHVHFATRAEHLRARRPVLLRLDVEACLRDGVPVLLATSGVVLVPGPLPARYVTELPEELPPARGSVASSRWWAAAKNVFGA